jgi:acetyl-CoA decarbonylase/synthase complex subunit gamma
MPLTGIEIFKLLPRKNCGECGVPTCLAFAMNLASGKAELSSCPYVSEEAKEKLADMAAPPIRPVTIGVGERAIRIGGETVMFRHEKRFENPPGIAIFISDVMPEEEIRARAKRLEGLWFERVGKVLRGDLAAIRCDSGDPDRFKAAVEMVLEETQAGIILWSMDPKALDAGLSVSAERKPLLYAATAENISEVAEIAKRSGVPVAVKGKNLDEASSLSSKLSDLGIKDIVLDSGARSLKQAFWDQVLIRRAALVSKERSLGYPTIVFPCEMAKDPMDEALMASAFVAKYGGIIVLSDFHGEYLFPLLVGRLNIFTDPQRPLATTEGIYQIGNPDSSSPVLITSNFSLTYFIVSGEISNSRVPSWLLVKDTEGLSVLTAWAGGKFSADLIASFVKKCGIAEKVKHRKLIIPGYLAPESGALEDELGDWEVIIGPREAANIPVFLRMWPFEEGGK